MKASANSLCLSQISMRGAPAIERCLDLACVRDAFDDVRMVAGSGDRGADVLGVKNGELWVIQCKFTAGGYPQANAVDEVGKAARFGCHAVIVKPHNPNVKRMLI
jgi:HJR/Mrr/RecB family endonuclease